MKKYVLIVFLIGIALSGFAQKFAYVDSEYILKHMPEYRSALSQLDEASQQWQKDVDARFAELDKMYKAYQADQVLLTEDMRKRRENEIIEKEKAAKEFQRSKFGPDGDLFQSRMSLLKPIQEKVANTVKQVATAKFLDFVFDRANEGSNILYASSAYDLSNEVITRLGYKPDANIK